MTIDRRMVLAGGGLLLVMALPGVLAAAEAEKIRLRGTIDKLDGAELALKAGDGTISAIAIDADTLVTVSRPSSLQALKPGDFIASAAVTGSDGKLHSTEVRIFPEVLRGIGEGQRPMDQPGKTMTNAAVAEVVSAAQGTLLKVKFKGGESELVVDPGVPVSVIVVASVGDLKPGMNVFVQASKGADGRLTAIRVFQN